MESCLFFFLMLSIACSKLIRIPLEYQKSNFRKTIDKYRKIHQYFPMQRLPIESYKMLQYKGMIRIGSEIQEFRMIFDTGCTLTWVTSKSCSSCQQAGIVYDNLFHVNNN